MSLRHGVLGLLAEGPASGYDLAQRFQEVLGPVWPARHPQIYAELARLLEAGYIEVESEGPRGRKAYRITDAGLAEVRHWLAHGDVDHTVRLQSLLRPFFFWLMEPEELQRHLTEEVRFFSGAAEKYRSYAAAKDRGEFGNSPRTHSLRVAVEAGIRLYQALADWAEWAKTVPPAAGAPRGAEEAEPPSGRPGRDGEAYEA